jgi:glutamyl-tRNA synthetase
MKIITRFAPSPTGFMHIGGVRTALFAHLWAKKNNGTFILRIEDTDQERLVPGSVEHIIKTLKWFGIDWQYGPDKPGPFGSCIQSERLPIYKKYAEELIAKGLAYPDPYTKEEVEAFRKKAEEEKRPFLYREHRPATFGVWDGTKPLRLKVPEVKRYKWNDVVRGELEAGEAALDDFVLIKSDGFPTYNFAHIIDDHEMGVTHVFRADEFVSSTPRFLSLYDALGLTPPVFATLPPILRDDRTKKLGKRDGAKDVLEYKKEGYLSEAVFNYLALLGWHPTSDKEVMSVDELTSEFTLERIQKGGAVFDTEKLNWFNKEYINKLSDADFDERARSGGFMPEWLMDASRLHLAAKLRPIIREKISVLGEIRQLFEAGGELAFVNSISDYATDMLLWKKNPSREAANDHVTKVRELVGVIPENDFTAELIKSAVWDYAEEKGKGDVLWPLRVALTGQEKSPDPFMSAFILGKYESLKRIDEALAKLS